MLSILVPMTSACPKKLVTVFIVDDSASIRERLDELIGDIDCAAVIGHAETPTDAIEQILATRPDCVILDYRLRGGTGVEVLQAVHGPAPATVFVVLTNHATVQYRRICMEAGASYFMDKSIEFRKAAEVVSKLTVGQA